MTPAVRRFINRELVAEREIEHLRAINAELEAKQKREDEEYAAIVEILASRNAINAELEAALEWIAEDDGGRAGECARAAIAKAKEARHG